MLFRIMLPSQKFSAAFSAEHETPRTLVENAYLALRMADRGYVMETGRIVLAGRAADLLIDDHVRRAYLGA